MSTSAAEWLAVDANSVSVPNIVSSSDLFDGELFGDELIDIYHSSTGTGNELPDLLPPHVGVEAKNDSMEHLIESQDCNIDDGLGAFRAPTSFPDLTVLPGTTTSGVAADSTITATSDQHKVGKKRGASPGASPRKRSKVVSPGASSSENEKKPNTPNPLVSTHLGAPVPPPPPLFSPPITNSAAPAHQVAHVRRVSNLQAPVSPSTSDTNSNSGNTEADFKSVAQAAVSSLIVNVSNNSKAETAVTAAAANAGATAKADGKVDTSTAHIKALTGNNWVAACSSVMDVAVPSPSINTADTKADRAKRANLTADERARQNRDRNREHARNTRLRKKAYVEELKRTLIKLVEQRDADEFEKRRSAQREVEQREVRFRVIEEFLKLRGRNEVDFSRWSAILDDAFVFTLPVTDYRQMVKETPSTKFEQVLNGVSEVMADASNFSSFLQGIGRNNGTGAVTFQYRVDRKDFFMDGCNAVLEWSGTSVSATSQAAHSEFTMKGIFRGKYCPASNKLLSAIMSFDTGPVLAQTQPLEMEPRADVACDEVADAAAQTTASQADALLDSLVMARLPASVPSAVLVPPSSSSSCSSEESVTDDKSSSSISGDNGNAEPVSP